MKNSRNKPRTLTVDKKNFDPEAFINMMFNNVVCLYSSRAKEADVIDRMQKKHAMGVFRQRRKEAMLRLLPVVKKECFPTADTDKENILTASFLSNEFVYNLDYNSFDCHRDFRLGAIIWILDQLKRAGNLEKALEHLPYFGNRDEYPLLPKNFYHPCYSNTLLESMMFVISMRFRSSQEKELEEDLINENIILEENAEGRDYNVTFREIINLLPQDAINKVCSDFRDMVMNTIRIFLKGQHYLREKQAFYEKCVRDAGKAATTFIDKKSFRLVGPVASPKGVGLTMNTLGLANTGAGTGVSIDLAGAGTASGTSLYNDCNNVFRNLGHYKAAVEVYCNSFNHFFFQDRAELHDFFEDKDIEDLFLNYSVKNPLGLCFALIYLIDHGDDIPWLFQSGGTVLAETWHSLPWGPGKKEDGEDGTPYFTIRCRPYDFTPDGWPDHEFDTVDCCSRRDGDINLPQAFYRLTGCCLPTGSPDPFDGKTALAGFGLTEYETGFVSGAAYTSYLSSRQYRLPEETDLSIESGTEETGDSIEATGEEARKEAAIADLNSKLSEISKSREDLQADLLQARREIKCLKRALAEDRKKYAAEILQKDEELNKARMEHRELVDLREVLFSGLDKASSSGPETDASGSLPYETQKRVVVFGGHVSFINQLKAYLPKARFVDVDNIAFNPDIVRNADVVWIQNNCISHSQFWNVVKEARQHSVQVRYFAYSSAEKSALQVVEDDMSSSL